jgi:integrase
MVKGKKYVISPKQLRERGFVVDSDTKEGSIKAANQYWDTIEQKLNPVHPFQPQIAELLPRQQWAEHHEPDLVAEIKAMAGNLEKVPHALAAQVIEAQRPSRVLTASDVREVCERMARLDVMLLKAGVNVRLSQIPLDMEELVDIFNVGKLWKERTRTVQPAEESGTRTIGTMVRDWLAIKRQQVGGKITPGRFANLKRHIDAFADFLGRQSPAGAINEQTWHDYNLSIIKAVNAGEYGDNHARRGLQGAAQQFCEFCFMSGWAAMPKNLRSKELRVHIQVKKVKTLPLSDIRTLYTAAQGPMRLYLLLMLNCGFRSGDISSLQRHEINWERGTITRQRVKTKKHHPGVPTVTYKLWPETLRLLKEHDSGQATVLLNTRGNPLVVSRLTADDGHSKWDNVGRAYERVARSVGIPTDHKRIRATMSSLIGGSQFMPFTELFLGESPRGIAAKHYKDFDMSQKNFDNCLEWLRKEVFEDAVLL